jgi:hypothetical protein
MPPPPAPAPPAAPPPPAPGATSEDPHGIGPASSRLGDDAKQAGEHAFGILGVVLREGEHVEALVQGRFNDANGVVALTNQRLLAVNDKGWKPDVVDLPLDPALDVQGWQEGDTATLVLRRPERTVVFDKITDGNLAAELATTIRGRTQH